MTEEEIAQWGGDLVQRAGRFLQILQEMEEKNEADRNLSGTLEGPFFSRAVYELVIKIGLTNGFKRAARRRRLAVSGVKNGSFDAKAPRE